jgi:uncharacterized membrane protein YhaH (DUF805 family)
MTLAESIKTCLVHRYGNFTDQASRSEFWWFSLSCVAGFTLSFLALGKLGSLLFMVATFIPVVSSQVRRLHDLGRSGWWLLLNFTPVGILLLVYFCFPGESSGEYEF